MLMHDRFTSIPMTIDWQVIAQYHNDRLRSNDAIWWR